MKKGKYLLIVSLLALGATGCTIEPAVCEVTGHMYGDTCEPESAEHCGSHEKDCTIYPGIEEVSCIERRCVASRCKAGYHLDPAQATSNEEEAGDVLTDIVCIADTITACGKEPIDCANAVSGWQTGACNEGVCQPSTCQANYHVSDDKMGCDPDNPMACGLEAENCLDRLGWASAECINGRCSLLECAPNYHIMNHEDGTVSCASDTEIACGADAVDCTKSIVGWENGSCRDGQCVVSNCKLGYHLSEDGSICEEDDAEHCANYNYNCNDIEHWVTSECIDGACHATECEIGYHIETSSTGNAICIEDTIRECGETKQNCIETVRGWADGVCSEGVCLPRVCVTGYHLSEDDAFCDQDSIERCGSYDTNCATSVAGWSNGTCENATCVPIACQSGYHYVSTSKSCEEDTVTACGSAAIDCTARIGWSNGSCTNGTCVSSGCDAGYYKCGTTCCKSTITNCGASGRACSSVVKGWSSGSCTNNTCVVSSCLSGYHKYLNKCELNTLTNCGTHGYTCSQKLTNWSSGQCTTAGKCTVSACASGYHVYQNACEEDSQSNCGSHGNVCTVSWYTFLIGVPSFCSNGKCT